MIIKIKDIFILVIILIASIYINIQIGHNVNSKSHARNNIRNTISKNSEINKYNDALNFSKECFKNYRHSSLEFVKCLEKNTENNTNIYTKYFYAIGLYGTNQYDKAINVFEDVLKEEIILDNVKINIQEALDKAKEKQKKIKQSAQGDYGDYFADIRENCNLVWKNPNNIKVYIQSDIDDIIKKAFAHWDAQSGSFIDFEYVNNENEANIIANFKENSIDNNIVGISNPKTVTYKTDNPFKKYYHKTEIEIYTHFKDNTPIDEQDYYPIALHEIGHAIGICEHSTHAGDIMYYSTDSYSNYASKLSNRDINTVKKLYGNIL